MPNLWAGTNVNYVPWTEQEVSNKLRTWFHLFKQQLCSVKSRSNKPQVRQDSFYFNFSMLQWHQNNTMVEKIAKIFSQSALYLIFRHCCWNIMIMLHFWNKPKGGHQWHQQHQTLHQRTAKFLFVPVYPGFGWTNDCRFRITVWYSYGWSCSFEIAWNGLVYGCKTQIHASPHPFK